MHDPATTTTVGTTVFPSPEPTNLPTTAISDMLNITCSTFESISGILNKKVFMHSEPLVIVIPFVFSMISKISSQNKKNNEHHCPLSCFPKCTIAHVYIIVNTKKLQNPYSVTNS